MGAPRPSWAGSEILPGEGARSGAGNAHAAFYGFWVYYISFFFFFFLPGLGDNRSLIRAGAQRWRLRGGGASQGWRLPGPDLLPGKNPGNPPLAQLLKQEKTARPPLSSSLSPPHLPEELRRSLHSLLFGDLGSHGSRGPPHPTWEPYSHLVGVVLRTGI